MAGGGPPCFPAHEWLPGPEYSNLEKHFVDVNPKGSQISLGSSSPREDSFLSWPLKALWQWELGFGFSSWQDMVLKQFPAVEGLGREHVG